MFVNTELLFCKFFMFALNFHFPRILTNCNKLMSDLHTYISSTWLFPVPSVQIEYSLWIFWITKINNPRYLSKSVISPVNNFDKEHVIRVKRKPWSCKILTDSVVESVPRFLSIILNYSNVSLLRLLYGQTSKDT